MLEEKVIQKISLKFIFIIFLFPLHAFTQDISGVWTGYIYNDTTHKNIHYELAINDADGKSGGYSHTTFVFDSVKNIGVKTVKIKIKEDHIFVEDNQFIYNNYSIPPPKGVKMYSALVFSQNDSADLLSGMWRTNGTKIYSPVTGTVFLERKRKEKPQETIIVAKLIDLGLRDKLTFLKPEIAINNSVAINQSTQLNPSLSTPVSTKKETKLSDQKESGQQTEGVANKNESKQALPKKEEPAIVLKEQQPKETAAQRNEVKQENQRNSISATSTPSKKEENHIVSKKDISKKPVAEVKSQSQQKNISSVSTPKKEEPAIVLNEKKFEDTIAAKKENAVKPATQIKQESEKNDISPHDKKENSSFATNENPLPEPVQAKTKPEVPIVKEPAAAAEISKRTIETIRTVEINQDSLVLSLYDNGTVDGDTVSVLLNGEVIMPRVGLRATAINKTIYLTPEMGDSISVIMYAENLGSIPPNTGLLVIREAKRIFEIRFSGDLNKNSKIILIRKKNE